MSWIRVRQGASVASIATIHGHHWETVWNHPDNADLKHNRTDPNVLHAGDELFVPVRNAKQESCATDKHHRFKRNGIPEKLKMQILYDGEKQALKPYLLDVEGKLFSGKTDPEGRLEHPLPTDARSAQLEIGEVGNTMVFKLRLGNLEPADEITGVQARLRNLGFDPGMEEGMLDEGTRQALKAFQLSQNLDATGEINQSTIQHLQDEHLS